MASEVAITVKALIQRLERRIARAERALEAERQELQEAIQVYSNLVGGSGEAPISEPVSAPVPLLNQAILLAVEGAAHKGCLFEELVDFVNDAGVETNAKSVRATAHRLAANQELHFDVQTKTYTRTESGSLKLSLLQRKNPVLPKKREGRPKTPSFRTNSYSPKLKGR